MSIILGIIIFIAGLVLGVHIKGVLLSRLEWNILKWDKKIYAYRLAQKGVMINRDEKVFMALRLPTANMPEEGFKFE